MSGAVFDAGGTWLRAALFSAKWLARRMLRRPSPSFKLLRLPDARLKARLVDELAAMARELGAPDWACVSICGPVSADGVVRRAPPIWGAAGRPFHLQAALAKRLRVPCRVVNDLSAAAAGYGRLPKYARLRRICVVAVSTGVGNKIFDTRTREVLIDPAGLGGELGHARVDFSGRALPCDCGGKGHVASYASGRGVERLAKGRLTAEQVAAAARRGDARALELLERSIEPLARAMALLAGSAAVEKFILTGGFALAVGPLYRRVLLRRLTRIGIFGFDAGRIGSLVDMGTGGERRTLAGAGILYRARADA